MPEAAPHSSPPLPNGLLGNCWDERSKRTAVGDLLHAIDEPATPASARSHAFPHISAAQHANGIEATRCSLWQCEARLLADCWQLWGTSGVVIQCPELGPDRIDMS